MVVFFSITYQPTTEAKKVERENQAQKTPLNDGPSTSPEPEAKLFHLNEETSTNVTPPPPALPPPPPVNPVPPPPTTPAETYTVTVTSNGTISPASLTISVGSVVNFVYTNPNDEVILTFSPKPPNDIKLDHEYTQKSYTFTNAGTFTFRKRDGSATQGTIVVQ